ncbi:ferrous iron transport protein B [Candidatus Bathyarchaeota archaeon]|nr:MAG: ferrous iron transport protein B [Candidatus Bathyarchaeota archaeon]
MLRIALVGQPNSGKSTLFNAVSGLKVDVSNFPGTTVKYTRSRVYFLGRHFELVDLPGTYSLEAGEPAESVAVQYLLSGEVDLIINVVDASLLARSLEFTLELAELGLPMVVALNMMDEAERKGLKIDVGKLEEAFGLPFIPTVANRGRGIVQLFSAAFKVYDEGLKPKILRYRRQVEDKVSRLEEAIPEELARPVKASKRFLALRLLQGDPYLTSRVKLSSPELSKLTEKLREMLEAEVGVSAAEAVAGERHHLAMMLFEASTKVVRRPKPSKADLVDKYIMHPVLGYVVLGLVFYGLFTVVFSVGQPLEELLLTPFENLMEYFAALKSGYATLAEGVLLGLAGGVAVVLPYFVPLVFIISLLEDVGYLPRVAFLMDSLMHRLGLHGKSVVSFILGYGCTVPAIMSTRILESPRDRLLTVMLVNFIPCSARTAVILALVAFYLGPQWALFLYLFNLTVIAALSKLLSSKLKAESPGLILEIPSYKLPPPGSLAKKVWLHLREFVFFAWPILILGSLVMVVLELAGLLNLFNLLLEPLTVWVLGLPKEVGVTLILGILRKELTLVMLIQALGTAKVATVLSPLQIMVFTIFITFYVPCISTIMVTARELGWKMASAAAFLSLFIAILLAFAFRTAASFTL